MQTLINNEEDCETLKRVPITSDDRQSEKPSNLTGYKVPGEHMEEFFSKGRGKNLTNNPPTNKTNFERGLIERMKQQD